MCGSAGTLSYARVLAISHDNSIYGIAPLKQAPALKEKWLRTTNVATDVTFF